MSEALQPIPPGCPDRRSARGCWAGPSRRIRTPPTSENTRIWNGWRTPGPGSGPLSTLAPPIGLSADASTRIPGGTQTRTPLTAARRQARPGLLHQRLISQFTPRGPYQIPARTQGAKRTEVAILRG
jgi:hypothetical protein